MHHTMCSNVLFLGSCKICSLGIIGCSGDHEIFSSDKAGHLFYEYLIEYLPLSFSIIKTILYWKLNIYANCLTICVIKKYIPFNFHFFSYIFLTIFICPKEHNWCVKFLKTIELDLLTQFVALNESFKTRMC